MFDIPLAKGYALIAGMMSIDPWIAFSGCTVEGFIKQEVKQLMEKAKK